MKTYRSNRWWLLSPLEIATAASIEGTPEAVLAELDEAQAIAEAHREAVRNHPMTTASGVVLVPGTWYDISHRDYGKVRSRRGMYFVGGELVWDGYTEGVDRERPEKVVAKFKAVGARGTSYPRAVNIDPRDISSATAVDPTPMQLEALR